MKQDGVAEEGKERTKREGSVQFAGLGFQFGSLAAPHSSASPIANASLLLLLLLLLSPIRSVAVEYDVRDGRGSILWRVEGVHERLWHAHTPRQAGGDLRTRIPYANLFPPLCQQLC